MPLVTATTTTPPATATEKSLGTVYNAPVIVIIIIMCHKLITLEVTNIDLNNLMIINAMINIFWK